MKNIVVVLFDSLSPTGFGIIKKLMRYGTVDDLLLFGNGVKVPDNISDQKVPITALESEIRIPLDRVYRQVFSFISQYFEVDESTKVILINSSDSIPEGGAWIDEINKGLLIKDGSDVSEISKVPDLFKLMEPLSVTPVLLIGDIRYALQSRDLYSFMDFFISNSGGNLIRVPALRSNYSYSVILSTENLMSLIRLTDFESPNLEVIKYLISQCNDTSSDI